MNRIRKDNKGVSPVIATILMVAITVVLAGVLVVYLQTLPSSGGDVETNLGLRCEKNGADWLISIISGSKTAADVTLQVIDPATGAATRTRVVTTLVGGADVDGMFNQNNGGTKLDAGDTILIHSQAGIIAAGYKVQFLKGSSIIGTIKELPS
jgi:flagellin-like protein